MNEPQWKLSGSDTLVTDFFLHDDIKQLVIDAGTMLNCPLVVLDDTFHICAYYTTPGFSDEIFQDATRCGQITYEAGAIISNSTALRAGIPDYINLKESPFRRRFAPLRSSGISLGYLVCVDTDGHLNKIPAKIWKNVEMILAKQLFIDASHQDKPFETAEDILMNLLDGKFSSEAYFQLQCTNTYLADFHPSAFALIDLTAYHNMYLGKYHLKEELSMRFPLSHSFMYKGDIFLFLHEKQELSLFSAFAEEFHLKIIISDFIHKLFELPLLYATAHEALELMLDKRFHGTSIYTVSQLRTVLMLKNLANHKELISPELHRLSVYDHEKETQYCETLYWYLTCNRSLKKTCDALYMHRNTVLYRIRKIQEDFGITLDNPSAHLGLLLEVSVLLFNTKGADFFLL